MNKFQETIQVIIDDINSRDFKNCKKDCYGTNCKHIEECNRYYCRHKEKFALEDVIKELRRAKRKVEEKE